MPLFLPVLDLGRMAYAPAYEVQLEHHARVLAARESGRPIPGFLLLVEHDPPVITITPRQGARDHLIATALQLAAAGVTIAETDRGGDITYHGPGQLVAYPILDLNSFRLRLHDYMRLLEASIIDTCDGFGVPAGRDDCATGVWVGGDRHKGTEAQRHKVTESNPCSPPTDLLPHPVPLCLCASVPSSSKICALGIRIRRWISLHGLALNVTTNLDHFRLIVPCGLAGRPVTSLANELGDRCPPMHEVKQRVHTALTTRLAQRLTNLPAASPL